MTKYIIQLTYIFEFVIIQVNLLIKKAKRKV